jgi:hypothetical protein
MSNATDMQARHDAILAELTADGLQLARDLKADFYEARAAKDREAEARLSLAWHRVTRSLRQTLALEAMLGRWARREALDLADRDELQEAVDAGEIKPHGRVGARLIWHEQESQQITTWNAFLDKVAAPEEARQAAIRANPELYVAWLEAHAERVRRDYEQARAALALGQPFTGGILAEAPDTLHDTYGLAPAGPLDTS